MYWLFLFFFSSENERMQITSGGFQFLLMDTSSQVWFFILKYLETITERGLSLEGCLTFLFKLSFSTLGKVGFNRGWGNFTHQWVSQFLINVSLASQFPVFLCSTYRIAAHFFPIKKGFIVWGKAMFWWI